MSWAAVIAGGVALVGAGVQANASKKAASSQKSAANDAMALEAAQYGQTRADLAPWRARGGQALDVLGQQMGLGTQPMLSYEDWLAANPNAGVGGPSTAPAVAGHDTLTKLTRDLPRRTAEIGDIFGLDPFGSKKKKKKAVAAAATQQAADLTTNQRAGYDAYVSDYNQTHAKNPGVDGDLMRDFTLADFQKDPGYQFRLDEANKGIERSAAARVGLFSGAAGKALDRYTQDYASGEYSNAYNRFNNDRTQRFNRLSALAGTGQTATNELTDSGARTTSSIADLITQRGNASAAGAVGQANAVNQGIGSLADFYMQQQYLKRLPTYSGAPRSVDSRIPG